MIPSFSLLLLLGIGFDGFSKQGALVLAYLRIKSDFME